ncbi:hypothetical protein BD289DRAFT_178513 [Coniella lustricola]|uniref:Uncharacterized protein n=1 Tax=Coniella lustricola TaxID=2025994 RepID=A0A2T3ADJ8_9PEZI|nr:hypothetical protein BD289DRAFT_178513 [Coniella lustricola]
MNSNPSYSSLRMVHYVYQKNESQEKSKSQASPANADTLENIQRTKTKTNPAHRFNSFPKKKHASRSRSRQGL